jgi:hypothetical protein
MMKQTIKNFLKTVSNLITYFSKLLQSLFSILVQISKTLCIIIVYLKISFFTKNIPSQIMILLSLLYFGILSFFFMWLFNYKLWYMFQLVIFSLFSFAISIFISDNFKFSNNKFIFLLQKFVSYSLSFALIVLVG